MRFGSVCSGIEAASVAWKPLGWQCAFLEKLASMKQGRIAYALVRRDDAMGIASGLLSQGYIRNRRLGYDEGFQITPMARAYLAGDADV